MLKFLRKYNKSLFGFFSVLLMLTWLVPSAIQQISKQSAASNAVWATVGNGEKITLTEQQKLTRQLKMLDVLKLPMAKDLGISNYVMVAQGCKVFVYKESGELLKEFLF